LVVIDPSIRERCFVSTDSRKSVKEPMSVGDDLLSENRRFFFWYELTGKGFSIWIRVLLCELYHKLLHSQKEKLSGGWAELQRVRFGRLDQENKKGA